MTDKELLELAAKAAGIKLSWVTPSPNEIPWEVDDEGQTSQPWNPLTDDGDALRLAVKLRLLEKLDWWKFFDTTLHYDAATRRAIVRAAAEIGRGMP